MAIACDECNVVLDETNPDCVGNRVEFSAGRCTFQILVATDNVWNTGNLCKKCLKKLIAEALK